MRKILLLLAPVALVAACNPSPNPSSQNNLNQIRQDSTDNRLAQGDVNSFAAAAAIGSMMEIESSALMIKRTENRDVQNLATIMVKDHSMAQKELKAIALQEKLTLPQELPAEKRAILAKLDSLEEDSRNHYYAELMVKEHEEAVKLFRNATSAETGKLADFAKAKLPALEHHLMESKNVWKIMQRIRGDKGDYPLKISKDRAPAH